MIDMLKEESDDTLRALAEGALFTSSTLSTFGGAEEPAAPKEEAAETEEAAAAAQASSDEEKLFLCVSNTFLDLQGRKKHRRKSAPGSKLGAESGGNSSGFHVLIFQNRDIPIPFILIYFIGPSGTQGGTLPVRLQHVLGLPGRAKGSPQKHACFEA